MKGRALLLLLLSVVLVLALFTCDSDDKGREELCTEVLNLFQALVKASGYVFDITMTVGKTLMRLASKIEATPTPTPTPTLTATPATPVPAPTVTPTPTPTPIAATACALSLSGRDMVKCTLGAGVLILFFACLIGLSEMLSSIGKALS